jgi:DNA-directed RNA polymerase specialized sigma24 family protein
VDGEEMMAVPAQREALPDEVVVRNSRQRRLWSHVQGLPERCRQLIGVIAFADRPDYAHIAGALGMPVGSIGPTRGRCLAKLRDLLARDPQWEGLER